MDTSAESPPDSADLAAFERRKAMMRDLVFGLALQPAERPACEPGER